MDSAAAPEDRGRNADARPAGAKEADMWWLVIVIVLVLAAIVAALLVSRRRAALGSGQDGGDFTADQRNKNTVSNPNTGLDTGGLGGL